LRILLNDGDNTVAMLRNVFIQVRRGTQTLASVQRIAEVAMRCQRELDGPMGALLVLEDSAVVPEADVREVQWALVRRFVEDPRLQVCGAVMGDGVGAMLKRTVTRAMLLGNPRVRVFSTPQEAIQALARTVRIDEGLLTAAFEECCG
jgi:hypothetical protein